MSLSLDSHVELAKYAANRVTAPLSHYNRSLMQASSALKLCSQHPTEGGLAPNMRRAEANASGSRLAHARRHSSPLSNLDLTNHAASLLGALCHAPAYDRCLFVAYRSQ